MNKHEAEHIVDAGFNGLAACKEHYTDDEPLETLRGRIVRVTHAYFGHGSYGPEHDLIFVAELNDGTWLAVEEWEDTSGHGCQCHGCAVIYPTQQEALTLGVSRDQRYRLEEVGDA